MYMSSEEFTPIDPPVKVKIHLLSAEVGGRQTPVVETENFRPDMFFEHNNRQFWGQLNVTAPIFPGGSGEAFLVGSYPSDLNASFKKGSVIKLVMQQCIGTATIQ